MIFWKAAYYSYSYSDLRQDADNCKTIRYAFQYCIWVLISWNKGIHSYSCDSVYPYNPEQKPEEVPILLFKLYTITLFIFIFVASACCLVVQENEKNRVTRVA